MIKGAGENFHRQLHRITLVMHNSSTSYYEDLPPLPSYQISPLPPLISFIPDKTLTLLVPVAAYWGLSMIFHWIDIYDYFPQYRLHTPAEVAKRNRVSRWEVVRDVLIQQVVQIMIGTLLGKLDAEDVFGKEDYDVAVWARRIRLSQRVVPRLLSIGGVDAQKLGQNLMQSHPIFAGIVFGGRYPALAVVTSSDGIASKTGSSFAPWEIFVASAVFYYIIPALQYIVGMIIVDTWQYFLHRAMHMNKWLYSRS